MRWCATEWPISSSGYGNAGLIRAGSGRTRGSLAARRTGADCAFSITRNAHNHVVLECRSAANCQHFRIIGALGLTNDHVYEETPDWLISRLSRAQSSRRLLRVATRRGVARPPRGRAKQRTDRPEIHRPTSEVRARKLLHRLTPPLIPLTPTLSPSGRGR